MRILMTAAVLAAMPAAPAFALVQDEYGRTEPLPVKQGRHHKTDVQQVFAMDQGEQEMVGARVELWAGFDHVAVKLDPRYPDIGQIAKSAPSFGLAAGYDFWLGDVIVGGEAEISTSPGKTDSAGGSDTVNGHFVEVSGARAKIDRDIYIGIRAGLEVLPQTLAYVKAGYTNLRTAIRGDAKVDGLDYALAAHLSFSGFRAGIGIEHGFSRHLYGKIEYRYSKYNSDKLSFQGVDVDFGALDLDRHQVVVGGGVRF